METFKLEFTVQKIHMDCFNRTKPSAMLHFVMRTISGHCGPLGVGWEYIWPMNLTWVVGRSRLVVHRAPVLDEKIVVETWPMPATRSAFPRYAEARTESGELLFQCISLWALINKTERTLVLPSQTELKVPGIVRGGELPVPNAFATSDEVDGESQHLVCFSDLDTNGHANNTKYLEWVNDLLPSQFHKEHAFKDITLCYLSEALEGQTVRLLHRFHEDGSFQVDGLRVQTNDCAQKPRVFSALIKF